MNDNSIKSKTIEWLRFFCIVAVVLLHAKNDIESHEFGAYDVFQAFFSEGLCRVAVPIFFFISGYLFFIRLEIWHTNIYVIKLKKRVKSLLIPYILWNLISIIYDFLRPYVRSVLIGGETPHFIDWYNSIGGISAFWNGLAGEYPHNYPLWFIRDLMVFVLSAPIVYWVVKNTKVFGLITLYIAYLFNVWVKWPGLSIEGFFFFSFGAYFSVNSIDFSYYFKKKLDVVICFALFLVVIMAFSYGNNNVIWSYSHRLYTLLGTVATIGSVIILFQKQQMKVHKLLTDSSFFVYAAHGTIVLPFVHLFLRDLLPSNQIGLILRYFGATLFTVGILVSCYYILNKMMPKTLSVLMGGRVTNIK